MGCFCTQLGILFPIWTQKKAKLSAFDSERKSARHALDVDTARGSSLNCQGYRETRSFDSNQVSARSTSCDSSRSQRLFVSTRAIFLMPHNEETEFSKDDALTPRALAWAIKSSASIFII